MARTRPSSRQIRRRRGVAVALLGIALAAAAYLVLAATVLAPVDRHGSRLVHLEIHSRAVGRDLGVNVIVPKRPGPRGERSLLVFLHGRGGSEVTFNDAVFRGLPFLHGRGPLFAFPAGGVHGYWHDRGSEGWETYVMDEVIPRVVRRFGVDPRRLAIGGISMGGFGAFDDAADFDRNDVVGMVQSDPNAFGKARIWNDYGDEDPFRVYDEGFVEALSAGEASLTAHSWPGAHEGGYWNAHWPDYQRFYVNALNHCG